MMLTVILMDFANTDTCAEFDTSKCIASSPGRDLISVAFKLYLLYIVIRVVMRLCKPKTKFDEHETDNNDKL